MYNHLLYFIYWLINASVLYVFGQLFGNDVVLGNWKFSILESVVYSGFWVTFFIWCFWDFAIAKGLKFNSFMVTFGYFFLVNIFSFWLVSRFPYYAGFGVTGFFWVTLISFCAYFLQRFGRSIVVGKK